VPLVSCILATRNRPQFLQQAVKYYQHQSLTSSELVIVDDSDAEVHPRIPRSPAVQYIRLPERTSIGSKLNIGIQHSSGDIIQKLDDDDFYHAQFLARTSEALLNHGGPDVIVAVDTFLVLVLGHQTLFHAGGGWCAGATLAFFRQVWERKAFRDLSYREDGFFLDDHPEAARLRLYDPELFVAVRHGTNTWSEHVASSSESRGSKAAVPATEFFLRCTPYTRSVEDVLGKENAAYYRELGRDFGAALTGR
jgi:glycosyltransferase involved in cell wall biosynthesis